MTTIERQREETRTTDTSGGGPRRGILVVLGLVLALVVGGLVGYLIRGDGTDDIGSVVPSGDTELTARHEQMGELVAAYEQAWQEGDGEAAEAMFATGGTLRALGVTYDADDGEIADFIGGVEWSALDVHEPMLVREDMGLSFHDYDRVRTNAFTFTAEGDLLIVRHVIGG
jgi:hypothetical protein